MIDIPEGLYTPTRDGVVADAKNSWTVRSLEADPTKAVDVGQGTFPGTLAEVLGDLSMPHYANETTIAKSWLVRNTFGERLERLAVEKLGAEDGARRPAIGASGYIEATQIIAGGAHLDTTVTLVDPRTGLRFRVLEENDYSDGNPIAIIGVDTGPATNLAQGTLLQFEAQPLGVSSTATILSQNDGTGTLGLTGGRDAETDAELQARIIDADTNPPAAGNNAQVVFVAQKTASVSVEKAFVYPAWMGPGSTSVAFTLRPDANASRVPNSVQRGLVEADLRSSFSPDWTITVPSVLTQSLTIALGVTWADPARGWVDGTPWPEYIAGDPVLVSQVTGSLALRATTGTTTTAPTVGQTVALYSATTKSFKRKRISAVAVVTAGKSWDLTFTDALGASDSFTPTVGQMVSPWSLSLNRLPAAMVSYARTLGPGEMFSVFPDPGGRRKRWPYSPASWPSVVTNEGVVGAARASGAIQDVEVLLPATPYATTVGTPGVSVYLLQFNDFAAFPQT